VSVKSISFENEVSSTSFLEYAFVRWVLSPIATSNLLSRVEPQAKVVVNDRNYRVDYEIKGQNSNIVIELDGFEFHSSNSAFSYDRLRQNDLLAAGKLVLRFSYDSIRRETARCGNQLKALLELDSGLRNLVVIEPEFETPEMDPDPI